jgi:hypothetical protein
MTIYTQTAWLFILSFPVACISWTVTHEEIFREPRDYCIKKSENAKSLIERKIFYLFTCEYCFSHYIAIAFLFITDYKILFSDWRGSLIAGFSMVWIANIYMNIFALMRQSIKKEKKQIEILESEAKQD